MGMSIYEQVAIKVTTEKLKDPKMAQAITSYHEQLLEGEYPASYMDIVFQKFRFPPDIYDAYSFAKIHTGIRTGLYSLFQIPIGHQPRADCEVEAMNEILGALQCPFVGEFWGGCSDYDGYIKWEKPVHVLHCRDRTVGFLLVPPWQVPLEVGYTSAHKTLCTLNMRYPGLAKWPYGQTNITVLVNSEYCHGSGHESFGELKKSAYGDFHTLPNPYEEDWNKHIPARSEAKEEQS